MTWEAFLAAHAWAPLTLLLLLAASAFFSASETALFNLTRGQLYRMSRSSHAVSRLAASLMHTPQRTLNALLLGNMLVNVALTGISAVVVADLERAGAAHYLVAAASVAPLLMLILAGEVLPKMIAFAAGEKSALAVALPVSLFQRLAAPALWVLGKVFVQPLARLLGPPSPAQPDITADELGALLDLSARRGTIDPDANELLQEIIELSHVRVSAIMIPRVDVIACDVAAPPASLAALFRHPRRRKIPVSERDIDRIIGVVHAKRLMMRSMSRS